MQIQHTENKIARLENNFVFNAHYRLSANEQKIILFLASNIDLNKSDFEKQIVPVVVLDKILNQEGKKWGSLYDRMQEFTHKIIGKHISFRSDFQVDGRRFTGYINWFQSIAPCRNALGEVCLEFEFSNKLKPFLLQLKEYVKISRNDIAPMKSGFSIRAYSILKAYRDKMRQHEAESRYDISLEEFKAVLGVEDKYDSIDNLKRRVLNPIKKEINLNSTSIQIAVKDIKDGRTITGFVFTIKDRKGSDVGTPNVSTDKQQLDIESLSKSQLNAYQKLVDFGVFEGIARHHILPAIGGGGAEGFEDYFIDFAIGHFLQKSKQKNSATFVKWWQNKGFEVGSEDWSIIIEKLAAAKKRLQKEDPRAFENRLVAKKMTNDQFNQWYMETLGKK
jgi:plasmid replication initiation protein